MTPGGHSDGGRRALQITLGTLACIPFASGLAGMLVGPRSLPGDHSRVEPSLDNEYRYAHAIWFGAAPLIWSTLPQVERQGTVLRAVSATVFLGGLTRAWSWRRAGRPHPVFVGATALELGIPALALWQNRVAARAGERG